MAAVLAAVAAAVTMFLAASIPAAAAGSGVSPGMIGQGDGGQGAGDPSSAWISLIPATSNAIDPASPTTDPESSVSISLIPATSSAMAESAGAPATASASATAEPSIAVSGTSAAAGEGSLAMVAEKGAQQRDPAAARVQQAAGAISGPLDAPAPADVAGSAGRWAAIAAGAALVLAGGILIVLRARRLRHR